MASAHSANTGVKKRPDSLFIIPWLGPKNVCLSSPNRPKFWKLEKSFTVYTDPKFEILKKKEKNGFYFCVPQLQNFDVLNVK